MVRQPAVAGKFYPGSPERLRQTVAGFLAAAVPPANGDRLQGRLRALIAPHAGYPYSGPIAGSAFAALGALRPAPARVVLVGPAHYVPVRGLAASSARAFASPLGQVAVDDAAVARLRDQKRIRSLDAAHHPEHALEVELPFLQMVLDDFWLVPLLVGRAGPAAVAGVLGALWDDDTVIVVSSDLSHYHDYHAATRLDAATAQRIEKLQDVEEDAACGARAINGLLRLARQKGLQAQTIDLRNSGDTAGPRDRVVGYGAFIFTEAYREAPPPSVA